ncbi:426_t:CDS:2, partial [Scutellospora calospora]
ITHAIKCYVKLGYEIKVGKDIEEAIKNLSGTHVAEITPNRESGKPKFGTIPGITSWNEWKWPDDENEAVKSHQIIKPQLTVPMHSIPIKSWIKPIPGSTKLITQKENNLDSFYDTECFPFIDLTNVLSQSNQVSFASHKFFKLGWAQKENQKLSQKNGFARIAPRAKLLMETMFITGTVDRKKKMNALQMCQELQEQANKGELEPEEIPKLSTVQNWITKTAL